jgi:predicted transcriptional regulator
MGKAQEERKQRMSLLRQILDKELKESKEVPKRKIIADFCLETSLSRRTAEEYLQLLADAGEIQIDSICPVGSDFMIRRK